MRCSIGAKLSAYKGTELYRRDRGFCLHAEGLSCSKGAKKLPSIPEGHLKTIVNLTDCNLFSKSKIECSCLICNFDPSLCETEWLEASGMWFCCQEWMIELWNSIWKVRICMIIKANVTVSNKYEIDNLISKCSLYIDHKSNWLQMSKAYFFTIMSKIGES